MTSVTRSDLFASRGARPRVTKGIAVNFDIQLCQRRAERMCVPFNGCKRCFNCVPARPWLQLAKGQPCAPGSRSSIAHKSFPVESYCATADRICIYSACYICTSNSRAGCRGFFGVKHNIWHSSWTDALDSPFFYGSASY